MSKDLEAFIMILILCVLLWVTGSVLLLIGFGTGYL